MILLYYFSTLGLFYCLYKQIDAKYKNKYDSLIGSLQMELDKQKRISGARLRIINELDEEADL